MSFKKIDHVWSPEKSLFCYGVKPVCFYEMSAVPGSQNEDHVIGNLSMFDLALNIPDVDAIFPGGFEYYQPPAWE